MWRDGSAPPVRFRDSLLNDRVGIADPPIDPAQPCFEVLRPCSKGHGRPVNCDAANFGGAIGRDEGRRRPLGMTGLPYGGYPTGGPDLQAGREQIQTTRRAPGMAW